MPANRPPRRDRDRRRLSPGLEPCEARRLLSLTVVAPEAPVLEDPDGNVEVSFQVSIEPSLEVPVTVNLGTAGVPVGVTAPAVLGQDYAFAPGQATTLTFLPSDLSFTKTVTFTILGSYRIKPALSFVLTAGRPDTAETASGVGTIANYNSTVVSNTNSRGFGSFFGAISASNQTPGVQNVTFALPPGAAVITPTLPLPPVTDPTTIINGGGTVVLDGRNAGGSANGLAILADGVTVSNLTLANFRGNGLVVVAPHGSVVDGVTVLDPALSGVVLMPGTAGSVVRGSHVVNPGLSGIQLSATSGNTLSGNVINGDRAAGGFRFAGIQLDRSTGNTLTGNVTRGSTLSGLLLDSGSDGNTLSGNTSQGAGDSGLYLGRSARNVVVGNTLGGASAGLGNGVDGLTLIDSPDNTIGGSGALGNLVQGNALVGVRLLGARSTGNVVAGNTVGVGPGVASGTGRRAEVGTSGPSGQGNRAGGIYLDTASFNRIGGPGDGQGNLVSGNGGPGIQLTSGGSNTVQGNRVGVDSTGRRAAGNALDGVYLDHSSSNLVGGTDPGAGNVISGNGLTGMRIYGASAAGNVVEGNRIGTDASGGAAVGNAFDGIFLLLGARDNMIGGASAAAGNLISGNGGTGVQLFSDNTGPDAAVTGNTFANNIIGADALGGSRLPNASDGIFLNSAGFNLIGLPGAGNLISANPGAGVQIQGAGSAGNVVQANRIGTNAAGRPVLGNLIGVYTNDAGGGNTVVTTGPSANLISGNTRAIYTKPGTTLAGPSAASRRRVRGGQA